MEANDRRRSGGSNKTSKKGGRRIKQLTAEEEERRREEVKEKLRQKLELERRALQVVERLLDDSVEEDFLVDCAKFITPTNYKDTVEERFIAKLCGYPVCPNKLDKIPTQQFKISTKTNRVYDITERKRFCSNFCYKASKEFELQISKMPLWLRPYETPPEIMLLKKGDGGRSGEEVMLSEKCLNKEDIENPSEELHSSLQTPAGVVHSDSSDDEEEQDFVSSVVSQQQKPRVHWGDLPKHKDNKEEGQWEAERTKKQTRGRCKEATECQSQNRGNVESKEMHAEESRELHKVNTDQEVQEEQDLPEVSGVDEAFSKLNLCSITETETILPETKQSENKPSSTLTPAYQDNQTTASSSPPGLNITQVGMSKRGAAGLRHLLKNQEAKPDSVRLSLIECLRRTLKEWSTEETLRFLYGADHSLGSPFADVKEEKEELDEDDIEDVVMAADAGVQKRPSATTPDYETLQKDTQQLEVRVRDFYKGTWILPEEVQELNGNEVTVQDQSIKDPVLPLIDSQAQHLIQKRITVEKLSSCLKNIIGQLHLSMSDVSTDLNNLVRTFRFTNTNILHKTPEWTLIAVVLLHLLSEVSPLVRAALETSASVEYLNTLMEELGLQEQDLLNLVQLFKSTTHCQP
ncbi:putative RNA polymerase II subunit B1 CTD phosphatase rpap2 isoform X2 [Melanotaenia boesemani]|uniref:putative RNA polymerase II subunit B1 CTD phosphatase rpap2 isoform X2 n=1 Tax=Melanotaenia boesemani TaxID=1250792 RepID=UPI001C0425DE|nr:putative RNA polymerase II subunit B1 CTD phosphatase rpap2 isoform X2 [Melanotaenia boesemani]